jgi:aryl-alcohol dehydrogenase-like predicted oxidoreductase
MNYRQLGNSGVRVSVIGLGANRFGSENVPQTEVNRIIDAALDLGINFIDTSNNYTAGHSEETLGHALKGRGDKVVLATKFSFPKKDGPNTWGASRYQMMQAVEGSLRGLQTDHIDLYYAHRWDDTTPIEETLRAFDDLIRLGKVRYIGASAYALAAGACQCPSGAARLDTVCRAAVRVQPAGPQRRAGGLALLSRPSGRLRSLSSVGGRVLNGQVREGKAAAPGFPRRERPLRAKMHDRSQLRYP